MILRSILTPVVLLAASGCASIAPQMPTQEQLNAADYGQAMSQDACEAAVESMMEEYLKDPASAVYQHEKCSTGYWSSVPVMGLPIAYGYWMSSKVNAKNSFGGYTGFTDYNFLIRDKRVVRWCENENDICVTKSR